MLRSRALPVHPHPSPQDLIYPLASPPGPDHAKGLRQSVLRPLGAAIALTVAASQYPLDTIWTLDDCGMLAEVVVSGSKPRILSAPNRLSYPREEPTVPIAPSAWNRINDVLRNAAADGRRMLYEFEVYQILAELGLQVPRFAFVRVPLEVDAALLGRVGGKLVVKVVSPQIAHKQRVRGVKRAAVQGNRRYRQQVRRQDRRPAGLLRAGSRD